MKPHVLSLALLAAVTGLVPLCAQTRTSASYSLTTETVDAGGTGLGSANYHVAATVGGIVGLATVGASQALTTKSGYTGQLYDFTALQLGAAAATLSESGTLQLTAALLADDHTTFSLASPAVAWSVISGPLVSISLGGVATAGAVYENTGAAVGGTAGGFSATLSLTVLNVTDDDFGLYAGDGLPDAWQVQFFGLNNPLAAPTAEPLHDGQSNLLKFLTGYAPDNPGSRFVTTGTAVGGGNFSLQLSRVQPGTRYLFQRSTDLQNWTTVQTLEPVAIVQPFTQLLPAPGNASFFRVLIEPATP